MADLIIPTGGVIVPAAGLTQLVQQVANSQLQAGMAVYSIPATNQTDVRAEKADKTAQDTAAAVGIVVNSGEINQPVLVAQDGLTIQLGVGILNPGETYYISTTGAIGQFGDLLTGQWATALGFALDTDNIRIRIVAGPARP